MARRIIKANGKPDGETDVEDVKIIVVGDKKCGKTKFIEAFARRLGNVDGNNFAIEFARVYPCIYDIDGTLGTPVESRHVKIFEIIGDYDDLVGHLTHLHLDSNGIVFMYAIDDPLGFQALPTKWIHNLKANQCISNQPCFLVGNKRDLRENPEVVERLARDNLAPVTNQQGEHLKEAKNFQGFYECSSIDENDHSIHEGFHFIVNEANKHLKDILAQLPGP